MTSAMNRNNEQIDEIDFLVVDVETTGLSPEHGDRVCEIGAVKMRGGAIMETFGSLVDPQRPVSSGAFAVNRISPAMLADAPLFSDIADRLTAMMKNAVLVAYNAPFDLSFLQNEFRLIGSPEIKNPVVDALPIARQLFSGLGRYGQENVATVLGVSFPVRHRALEDATVTAQLFTMFTSILKAYDHSTLADLRRRDLRQTLHERRLAIVNEAMERGTNLWIKYFSPTEAEITDRIITPKECVTGKFQAQDAMYLIGYCHTVQADRNFRIDRILDLRLVNKI